MQIHLFGACGFDHRISTCPQSFGFSTENLPIHTQCEILHKTTTVYALFCPKLSTLLDKNVRKLGLQVDLQKAW